MTEEWTTEHWTIGRLAAASGLSLRTLRYWESLGLIEPSGHTEGGHRRYAPGDLERLYRVLALRSLGLSLDSIATCLDGDLDPSRLVGDQLAALDQQLHELTVLRERLVRVTHELATHRTVTPTTLLDAVRALHAADDQAAGRFLDADQIAGLGEAFHAAGPAARYELEVEWPRLYQRAQALLDERVPATDPAAQRIAARIAQLRDRYSGGDRTTSEQVRTAWRAAPAEFSGHPDPPTARWAAVADYLEQAVKHTAP